jgi:hypothetical protein
VLGIERAIRKRSGRVPRGEHPRIIDEVLERYAEAGELDDLNDAARTNLKQQLIAELAHKAKPR